MCKCESMVLGLPWALADAIFVVEVLNCVLLYRTEEAAKEYSRAW